MSEPSYAQRPPKRLGGRLCLDFINTVEWRRDPKARGERLTAYGELLLWAGAQGVIGQPEMRRLLKAAERHPEQARSLLADAIALREALARLLGPARRQQAADLEIVNHLLRRAPARAMIAKDRSGLSWHAEGDGAALARPLWPILWDAADLLTSARAKQVRRCADRRCGWLFLDLSRSQARRWCSMRDCGNRAKARRHYARSKATG